MKIVMIFAGEGASNDSGVLENCKLRRSSFEIQQDVFTHLAFLSFFSSEYGQTSTSWRFLNSTVLWQRVLRVKDTIVVIIFCQRCLCSSSRKIRRTP